MQSGFGVVLLGHRAVQVGPAVHDVVTETVVVEVLTLKDQSQSPAEKEGGVKGLKVID